MPADRKTLIVFGATGAVGHAVLKLVLQEHVMGQDIKVVAVGAEEAKCKEVEATFKVPAMCIDAKDPQQVSQVFDKHGPEEIVGVVNLIGDYSYQPLEDVTGEALMGMVQDNLLSSFNVLKAGCPLLASAGGGNVTCVGASVVHYGMKHHEAWAAAKGAVEAMHRSAAATYAASNVRVNCVAAGLVSGSPASAEVHGDPKLAEASAEIYPLKRLATPEDIAWAVCWLAHPRTAFVTGAAVPVDGGISSVQAAGLGMAAVGGAKA